MSWLNSLRSPYGVSLLWISFLMMGVLDIYTFLYLILKRRQRCGWLLYQLYISNLCVLCSIMCDLVLWLFRDSLVTPVDLTFWNKSDATKFVVICFQNFVLISICVVFWAVARTCQALQMPLTIKNCVEVEILQENCCFPCFAGCTRIVLFTL